jgi:nitrogen regulatory protein P-II 1
MKEIKAYIRCDKAEDVIYALEEAGVPGFTVIEVKAIRSAGAPEGERFSIEYAEKYCVITKFEIVCKDGDTVRLVDIIRENAHTGRSGDGMVFVSDIAHAVKIKTGEWGEGALLPSAD